MPSIAPGTSVGPDEVPAARPPISVSPPRGLAAAFKRMLTRPESGAVLGLIFVYLFFAVLARGTGFVSVAGTANWLDVAASAGLMGSAATLLLIAGDFDLSIGSMVGLSGILLAVGVTLWGMPLWAALLMTFAVAIAFGWFQGWLVVKTGLSSIIVTLAGLFFLRGVTLGFTRTVVGRSIVGEVRAYTEESPLTSLFTAKVGPIDVAVIWWLGLALVATYVLVKTRFGNWIFATGGSLIASRGMGIPTNRVRIMLFMATSASAALLACLQVLSLGSADGLRGQLKEFEAIITAVIGGSLITGGYGSPIGTVIGAMTLGIVRQGLFFLGVEGDWYQAVLGVLLMAAVLINRAGFRVASGIKRW